MGVGGVFKFILRRLLEIFFIAALLVIIPNLPPHANFSKPFTVTPPKPFTGKLSLNNRLDNVELWHKEDFVGPESFADLNGELYTSLYTGDIVKLSGEHITPIIKFGKPCRETYDERICGRPLGIEFDRNGYLYAADAYYGIFRVNVETGKKEQLVSPKTEINGKPAKIFNSIALSSNGDIYWTDSTTDFSLEDGLFSLLADASGRLIHYDAQTKKNRVLIDEIHFANGVALADDEEFVLVAETARSRIHRYYLKGPKKGKRDVFIDGLPGLPDNLKADGKGGFLVPLVVSRDADHPVLTQSIGPFPLLRKAVARFLGVTEYVFKKIDELYPNQVCLKAAHFIGHFSSTSKLLSGPRQTLLRVNRNGEITDSAHNSNGKIASISEMHVFRDTLYLGSPFNDYIGRIPLTKLGWDDLRKDERPKQAASVESPKPTTTTTTAKPPTTTTPTPKPTTTTTTTPKPPTTPTTTTQKPTSTTQRPTTTTTTTTQKPVTTPPPPPKQQPQQAKQQTKPTTSPPKQQTPPTVKQQAPPPNKQAPPAQAKQAPPPPKQAPPSEPKQTQQKQTTPPTSKSQPKPAQ